MTELKTKPTAASVKKFIDAVDDEARRKDCKTVTQVMKRASGQPPKMWGSGIVGFGSYHYKYASGREGDWMVTGFSPRKRDLTIYIMSGFTRYDTLMRRLGKYKTGKSCLYIKQLADVDLAVLEELIRESVNYMKQRYK